MLTWIELIYVIHVYRRKTLLTSLRADGGGAELRFARNEVYGGRYRSRERTLRWGVACRPREIESLDREPKEGSERT